jgi:hypothetical protein
VRRQQSGQSVSRLVSRHRAAVLYDIVINENLKLLQKSYLAQKLDVLIFLLGHVLVTELMARPSRHSVVVCVIFHSQVNTILPAAIRRVGIAGPLYCWHSIVMVMNTLKVCCDGSKLHGCFICNSC